jgi:hypothetical protein
MTAWNEFQQFITTAQNHANGDFQNNIFFVDLHGHGNPIQRIELGYLLYDNELELPDETLNTTTYLNFSSIKNLALNNINNYSHAQMLRGPKAFGTILGNQACPSVPSQQIPFPGTNSNYFSGGIETSYYFVKSKAQNYEVYKEFLTKLIPYILTDFFRLELDEITIELEQREF